MNGENRLADIAFTSLMPESEGACICLKVDKPITAQNYEEHFLPLVKDIIATYGEIRILVYYKDFQGWEEEAARMNMFSSPSFAQKIRKVALINPPDSELSRAVLTGGDFKDTIRIYNSIKDFDAALAWVKS